MPRFGLLRRSTYDSTMSSQSVKPLIGITGKRDIDKTLPTEDQSIREYDRYLCNYTRAINEAGGTPILLALESDPSEVIKHLDGVVFSGGADIDPKYYNQQHDPKLGELQPERDDFEVALIKEVLRLKIPALGVCRGMQLFNVASGGTLHQHIDEHEEMVQAPGGENHLVLFDPDTQIGGLYGQSRNVNSLHHQSVDKLADGYRIAGRLACGSVEAIEHKTLPMLGVQWHPEILPQRPTDPLFSWLIQAAQTKEP